MKTRPRPGEGARRSVALGILLSLTVVGSPVLISQNYPDPSEPAWKNRPERFQLAGGPSGIYQRDESSPVTIVQIVIPGGLNVQARGEDGLAYLAVRLTLEIPDSGKAQDLMAQATRMRLVVREESSAISLACLSENLEEAVKVGSALVQSPLFSSLRIDHIKKLMSLYRKGAEDDAVTLGHLTAMRALFRGEGCGTSIYGTEDSLKILGKRDVAAFYGRFFTRSSVLFSICSNLPRETVQGILDKHFTGFAAGVPQASGPRIPAVLPEEREIVLEKDTKQSYISRAYILPAGTAADFGRAYLLEVLLGKGPGSRLWKLRTIDRLAYNVNAEVTWTKGDGLLEAYLETEDAKSGKASVALDATLDALHSSGLTEDEFVMAKSLARTQFLRSSETKESRAGWMGFWGILGYEGDGLTAPLALFEGVSFEDLNAYVRRVLDPDKAIRIRIGPRSEGGPGR